MKKVALALAAILACGVGHAADTLAKIKTANKIVIGTRDSSAPLAYTCLLYTSPSPRDS